MRFNVKYEGRYKGLVNRLLKLTRDTSLFVKSSVVTCDINTSVSI